MEHAGKHDHDGFAEVEDGAGHRIGEHGLRIGDVGRDHAGVLVLVQQHPGLRHRELLRGSELLPVPSISCCCSSALVTMNLAIAQVWRYHWIG
ncbi:hypothetical protein [Embleya sp. NPDC005575]|uniref:hypothetical protein n=1 Tax=Embleya sp. NPDC005575 TaxID=3156892 RepID=UPI0033B191BB